MDFLQCFSFATYLIMGLCLASLLIVFGSEFVLKPLGCFVGMQDPRIPTAMSSLAPYRTLRDRGCTCTCSSSHSQHLGFEDLLISRNAQLRVRVRLFLVQVTFDILGFVHVLNSFHAPYPA